MARRVVLAGIAAVLIWYPNPINERLRLWAFDSYQSAWPRKAGDNVIMVVSIDAEAERRHGFWPWPRSRIADLIEQISVAGARSIGTDIAFPAPDPHNPGTGSRRQPIAGGDMRLIEVIKRAQRFALGIVGEESARNGPEIVHSSSILVRGGDPKLRVFAGYRASGREYQQAAQGQGFVISDWERGTVRRMPVVAEVAGHRVVALGLELLRLATQSEAVSVSVSKDGIESISMPGLVLPTDSEGRIWLNFAQHDPARYISATEILAGKRLDMLRDRMVLVSVTGNQVVTPLGEIVPAAELQAQLVENIYTRGWLERPWWLLVVEYMILLGVGWLAIRYMPGWWPPAAVAFLMSAWLLTFGSGLLLYHYGRMLLDPLLPMVAATMVSATMMAWTWADTTRHRHRLALELADEKAAAAIVAGELGAARRIQLGMLPACSTIDDERVDVAVHIEPARVVGGDLYDFAKLDADRFYFCVGDVSGKGLPASIMMSIAKVLLRNNVLRYPDDLAGAMTATNAELARENPEQLFVSTFAAIMDLHSGRITYCLAGHDAPIIRRGERLVRLDVGGGPALCILDEFSYGVAELQLEAGDVLLMFTDGVTESLSTTNEMYGDRLESIALRSADATQLCQALVDDVHAHASGRDPHDDLTVLVVRWNKP